jgi:5,10-methylenetetrahydrofolate reductase
VKSDSLLERALEAGQFVLTAELGPPKAPDIEMIREKASLLKGHVTAANITDNQTAVVRVSSIAAATVALAAGLEPVIQVTCRDRNRLAMQSDILGAFMGGIRNVLCLTGDHQHFGNHPQARGVFDLDSVQLIQMLKRMRDEGCFQCGDEIKTAKNAPVMAPKLFIGAAANPFGDPFEARVLRLAKKVAAGADFIQTQPVFDLDRFGRWMDEVRNRGLHEKVAILAGVMPVKSYRALEYMDTQVPGIRIPAEMIDRMKKAESPKDEGVEICVEMMEALKKIEGVRGIHIMAVEWESIVPAIVEKFHKGAATAVA